MDRNELLNAIDAYQDTLHADIKELTKQLLLRAEVINTTFLKMANETSDDVVAFKTYENVAECRRLQGIIARKYRHGQ